MYHFKPIQRLLVIFIVIFLGNAVVYAYDDKFTHPALTRKAITASNLDAYLKQSLMSEFYSGVTTTINGTQVIKLLTDGSQAEDAIVCRRSTHFHNPLMSWDQAGLNQFFVNLTCNSYQQSGSVGKYSALTWATGYQTYSGPVIPRNNQQMGWDNARSYYYSALTSPSKAAREENFAKTFQAVGQVLHLLQDMAVPAHVRNDFITSHLLQNGMSNPYELYVTRPGILTTSTQTVTKPQFTNAITSDFWDTNIYTGSAPVPIAANTYGLSEYTNANFVSEATVFSTGFPYPHKEETNARLVEVMAEDGKTDTRYYIYPNNQNYTLAAYSYFSNETEYWEYILDERVYEDSAKLLLPRAVGYSAGLLDYFFRGQLGVSRVSLGIKVKNLNDEEMSSYVDSNGETIGRISVYYDDTNNVRHFWTSYPITSTFPLAPGGEVTILFADPSDNIQKGRYIVVFKGKLGNEEGAVAAKVITAPQFNIIQTGNSSFKIKNFMDEAMTGANTSLKLLYDDKNSVRQEIPLAITDASGNPVTAIAIPMQSVSPFMATLTQPATNAKEKGAFILQFTGKLGDTDVTAEQLITPHFLTHSSDAYGQTDIYEYDLLGNKIANLTEMLPRGAPYYGAQPNPVDSNQVIFYSNSGCSINWSCLNKMIKSTGQIESLNAQGNFWWTRDGSRIDSSLNYTDTCEFLPLDGSYSPDGAQLAVTGQTSSQRLIGMSDIIMFSNGALSRMVDMANYRIISIDMAACGQYSNLDQQYNESYPVYHPTLNRIVFDSDRQGILDAALGYKQPYDLYAVDDILGAPVVKLTSAPAGVTGYYQATWSPDGEKLLAGCQVAADDYARICIMPAAGGVSTIVNTDDGNHYNPQWLRYLGQ